MEALIETYSSLESFFEGLLTEALLAEKLALRDEAFSYLLKLFSEMGLQSSLDALSEEDTRGTPGLVFLYQRAMEGDPGQRFDAYRQMGDVALVVGGFFSSHLKRPRSLVSLNYYVNMGIAAYDSAAVLSKQEAFSLLFQELSQKFSDLVEVLTRIAESTTLPVNRDLATIYERLVQNPNSQSLAHRLIEEGSFPVLVKDKKGAAA